MPVPAAGASSSPSAKGRRELGPGAHALSTASTALAQVGQWLNAVGYQFVAVTPSTHARVNARVPGRKATSIEDVFGWNLPFAPSLLPDRLMAWLTEAGAIVDEENGGGLVRSLVRFSTLDNRLFVHSAFPTAAADAVFFGPDTYRFARLIHNILSQHPSMGRGRIVDVGCGAGPGGIVAYQAANQPATLLLTDINAVALQYASINAALCGTPVQLIHGDLFASIDEPVDLIVSNPPYLLDPEARLYRHGGPSLGADLSLRILRESLALLRPGGTLILYTGSCIVRGEDRVLAAVNKMLAQAPVSYTYKELDPDVFGEELVLPGYEEVDRIAIVALIMTTRPQPQTSSPKPGSMAHTN